MYTDIFTILAPVFFCAAVGYCWARAGFAYENAFVARLVMNIGAPCLVIGTLSKTSISTAELLQIITAAALVLVSTCLLAALLCRCFKLSNQVYLGPLTFPNTINMGVPICYFAFGDPGLAAALGVYLVVSLSQFSLGIALVSGHQAWRNTLQAPIVYAGLIAGALVLTDTRLPLWLENSVSLLGSFTIPVMLITLGVSLSQLKIRDIGFSTTMGLSRLLIGFCCGLLVTELLAIEGVIRGVIIILSTMPSAVFNYLLAHRYQRSPEQVAGLVVMSTLVSFITLPLLLKAVL